MPAVHVGLGPTPEARLWAMSGGPHATFFSGHLGQLFCRQPATERRVGVARVLDGKVEVSYATFVGLLEPSLRVPAELRGRKVREWLKAPRLGDLLDQAAQWLLEERAGEVEGLESFSVLPGLVADAFVELVSAGKVAGGDLVLRAEDFDSVFDQKALLVDEVERRRQALAAVLAARADGPRAPSALTVCVDGSRWPSAPNPIAGVCPHRYSRFPTSTAMSPVCWC